MTRPPPPSIDAAPRTGNRRALAVLAAAWLVTSLVGAYAAVLPDAFEATVAALAHYAVAGENAAADADGPGSFGWRFLDALAALTPAELEARARVDAA